MGVLADGKKAAQPWGVLAKRRDGAQQHDKRALAVRDTICGGIRHAIGAGDIAPHHGAAAV